MDGANGWLTRPGKRLHFANLKPWPLTSENGDFPMKNGGSFHSYVKLPEAMDGLRIQSGRSRDSDPAGGEIIMHKKNTNL